MADETLDQAAETSDEEQNPQVTDTEVTNTEATRKPPELELYPIVLSSSNPRPSASGRLLARY
jgi:hypothetical protein